MFCSKCGKQIDDDSDFCEFCGASVKPLKSGAPTPRIDGINVNQFRENNMSVSMNQPKPKSGYIKIAIIGVAAVVCLFIVYKLVDTVLISKDKDDSTIVVSDFTPPKKTDGSSITGVTVTGDSGNVQNDKTDSSSITSVTVTENVQDDNEFVGTKDENKEYGAADTIEDTIKTDNSIASSMDSSSDEDLPGSTIGDRYEMAEYADDEDLEIFKGSDDYVRKNYGFALQSAYLEGEQIMDYKDIEGGWRLISAVDGDFYDDSRYKALRYTNCYIKTDEDNVTVVFNYGVYYDASGTGANIDQTGNDPKIFRGKLAKKDKNPEYDYTYPFINMDAFTSDKDELIISQFTKAPDGREYAFGYIFWDNSNDDIEGEYIMLARP